MFSTTIKIVNHVQMSGKPRFGLIKQNHHILIIKSLFLNMNQSKACQALAYFFLCEKGMFLLLFCFITILFC